MEGVPSVYQPSPTYQLSISSRSRSIWGRSQGMPTESSARSTKTRKNSQLQWGSSWVLMVFSQRARFCFSFSASGSHTTAGTSSMAQAMAAISTKKLVAVAGTAPVFGAVRVGAGGQAPARYTSAKGPGCPPPSQ